MILAPPIKGLKGRQMIARGDAPGYGAEKSQALKGRHNRFGTLRAEFCVALSGLDSFVDVVPRALPWAIILRPFRAEEGTVCA